MKAIPHLRLLTEEVRAFERSGRYLDGFGALSGVWPDVNKAPKLEGLGQDEKASLLLRCGVLAGFLGRMKNSNLAQENSKNLLTAAREIFISSGDARGLVEAENWLSMAYLRKGEFDEAKAWIASSFSRDLPADEPARIESFIFNGLMLIELGRFEDALSFLRSVEPFVQSFDDDYFNGCFATNLGITLRNLGCLPEAMQMYNLARHFYRKIDHIVYLATVENNLANIYRQEGRFDYAHECADTALELHQEAGDLSRFGYTCDTKASIFFDEGRLDEASSAVEEGLGILRETEFTEFLVETLFTKIRIQAAQRDIAGAAITFSEAAEQIKALQGRERLEKKAKEFAAIINDEALPGLGRIFTEKISPGEELELELSPSLSSYSKFDAIWIKNRHLESVGLKQGYLALVVDEVPVNGDAIALLENGSDHVICGFFESGFGLIAVSKNFEDADVFKAEEIEIIGKIVGFADPDERIDGKLYVRPLEAGNS